MKLYVQKQGFVFSGRANDLKDLFKNYPGEITLLEFIRLNLN